MMKSKDEISDLLSRRDFLKFCGVVATTLGIQTSGAVQVAQALLSSQRPPVLWLHFAECTGCTESFLRTTAPWFDELIFNGISLDYHETLMAAAGHTVENILTNAADNYHGQFICIVEGAIPTADNGIYGQIGDKTMLSIAQEICPKAKYIIACGNCASYGGLPAAEPNPTGAKGLIDALPDLSVPVVNVPGCPPNPINLTAVIVDYLLNGSTPSLDSYHRPDFAYRKKVHSYCPYKGKHNCLELDGCKGKMTFNNCPDIQFNEGTSFPMKAGHPCIGCSEPGFWDQMTPFYTKKR
ncbi:MAG: hydrogenase small subunit [Desulfobacteraceae bacterium]|nr:hydrogenase small subunit [Desulfobacteraceae bacterium]